VVIADNRPCRLLRACHERPRHGRAAEQDETKGPNPIDVYVGSRVRMRRLMLNLSQEKLARHSDLLFSKCKNMRRALTCH
jgi:hypothetical protein